MDSIDRLSQAYHAEGLAPLDRVEPVRILPKGESVLTGRNVAVCILSLWSAAFIAGSFVGWYSDYKTKQQERRVQLQQAIDELERYRRRALESLQDIIDARAKALEAEKRLKQRQK